MSGIFYICQKIKNWFFSSSAEKDEHDLFIEKKQNEFDSFIEKEKRLTEEQLRIGKEQLKEAEEQLKIGKEQLREAKEQLREAEEENKRIIERIEREEIEMDEKARKAHEDIAYIRNCFFNKLGNGYSVYQDGKFENPNKTNETKIIEFKGVPHHLEDKVN